MRKGDEQWEVGRQCPSCTCSMRLLSWELFGPDGVQHDRLDFGAVPGIGFRREFPRWASRVGMDFDMDFEMDFGMDSGMDFGMDFAWIFGYVFV